MTSRKRTGRKAGKARKRTKLHVQTWLREGETMRRVGSRDSVSIEAFEDQRRPDVEYVILERTAGVRSGSDTRPAYARVE